MYVLTVWLNVNHFDPSTGIWRGSSYYFIFRYLKWNYDGKLLIVIILWFLQIVDASDTVTITWEQSGGASQADVLAYKLTLHMDDLLELMMKQYNLKGGIIDGKPQ